MKKNIVFLPCRKGSQRIPNKNTRTFAGIEGGLLRIKLEQLLLTETVDEIILSSDDQMVLQIGASFSNKRIKPMPRPESLCLSSTTTDELINYIPSIIKEDATIIWTHVTSPFISAKTYKEMIELYYNHLPEYDSLMSVNCLRTFIWKDNAPVNYNRGIEKWPRTQTLPIWYEVNSGAFIADISTYIKLHDRIGKSVQMYQTSMLESIDIDWPEDFEYAQMLYQTIIGKH
ncbi:MAG: acylneuraminate cytidylyltransferase family protein [Paludibacteraceae bacterium]|nr:acylneuraminate cytidylyltransferase family protein [Paludibacteraceae bacterium]